MTPRRTDPSTTDGTRSSRRRVTSYEVARESGVSQSTVSYVLNNTPNQTISDDTRKRVLATVERLGYHPFEPARTLSQGRSNVVLLVMPDFAIGHVMTDLLDKLSDVLSGIGKTLVIHRVPGSRSVVDVARVVAPVALISLYPLKRKELASVRKMGIVSNELSFGESTKPDVIANPQEAVGRIQAQQLLQRGVSHLGYARPHDLRLRPFWEPRLRGVRQACADAGIPEPSELAVREDGVDAPAAVALWRTEGVRGVCAYNDEIAFAVLHGAKRSGLNVPEDFAVVGVDDLPTAAVSTPPLTTVRIDVGEVARKIVAGLRLGVETGSPLQTAQLVVRESA